MRTLSLAILGVVLVSCGVEERTESKPARAQQEALSQGPVDLRTWRWGTRFFPSNALSAYVVAVQDPFDPSRFVAWGLDVRGNQTNFFVGGTIADDLPRLLSQVEGEIVAMALGLNFSGNVMMAVSKKPVDPKPGGNDWSLWNHRAWDTANKLHLISQTFGQ